MIAPWQPGDEVFHPAYGRGRVNRLIRGGRYLLVLFEGRRLLSQVSAHELAGPSRPRLAPARAPKGWTPRRDSPPPARVSVEALLPRGVSGEHQALQVLEALRVGVAPRQLVELYTVGREREMALVDADLDQVPGGGAARVFLGDYGAGKTHMLECIEERALRRNLLVARVTLDEREVAASHPRRVYRALVQNLAYPDRVDRPGLEPLLEAACEKNLDRWLRRGSPRHHHYLSPALAYFRELREPQKDRPLRESLLDWLEGHPTVSNTELGPALRRATGLRGQRLYALQDHRTLAHLYAYLLGGISVLARDLGYAGLAVLFDEAEFYSLLSGQGREFANLLFGYYAAAALGPEKVAFDIHSAARGGHLVHRSFPPIFAPVQGIYCVFALTEDPVGLQALQTILGEEYFTRLTPLDLEHFQELCRRVLELYRRTYPAFTAADQVDRPMGEVVYQGVERGVFENPRQVLKFVVELLDYSRLCRDRIPEYVRELRGHLTG